MVDMTYKDLISQKQATPSNPAVGGLGGLTNAVTSPQTMGFGWLETVNSIIRNANELLQNAQGLMGTISGQQQLAKGIPQAALPIAQEQKAGNPTSGVSGAKSDYITQILAGLNLMKTMFGDIKISTLIVKVNQNKDKFQQEIEKYVKPQQ